MHQPTHPLPCHLLHNVNLSERQVVFYSRTWWVHRLRLAIKVSVWGNILLCVGQSTDWEDCQGKPKFCSRQYHDGSFLRQKMTSEVVLELLSTPRSPVEQAFKYISFARKITSFSRIPLNWHWCHTPARKAPDRRINKMFSILLARDDRTCRLFPTLRGIVAYASPDCNTMLWINLGMFYIRAYFVGWRRRSLSGLYLNFRSWLNFGTIQFWKLEPPMAWL